eukprot:TRINITY_DN9292_c0_g1_i2.p3 TRINITY_DN9292_c0_g1~~TRINITY_DN9292_c0_g1_i2.p3  ORF type:complete len:138 (+),score=2.11 TRINITY_DN9292_c0_g1_i2:595-1008(+)
MRSLQMAWLHMVQFPLVVGSANAITAEQMPEYVTPSPPHTGRDEPQSSIEIVRLQGMRIIWLGEIDWSVQSGSEFAEQMDCGKVLLGQRELYCAEMEASVSSASTEYGMKDGAMVTLVVAVTVPLMHTAWPIWKYGA